ncbi:hypothetical protein CURTO8I2_150154 [Curtobacterium sp. 8I-2]|nr:hypothetical protein CURTO8I2_150154 [Curtobacterium sp. 8I-2]
MSETPIVTVFGAASPAAPAPSLPERRAPTTTATTMATTTIAAATIQPIGRLPVGFSGSAGAADMLVLLVGRACGGAAVVRGVETSVTCAPPPERVPFRRVTQHSTRAACVAGRVPTRLG